tara:strand:+ start:66 stop:266 length:201 start_codon:yes stop_codon:yes gene_type:complete
MAWLPESYKATLKRISQAFRGVVDKKVRARTEEGQFVADDKSTPDVNEAYTTVEVKKKKRGRPPKK